MSFPFPKPYPGPSSVSSGASGALGLLGNEWEGFALDFTNDTYATRTSLSAERLLGPNIDNSDTGIGVDFMTNTFAIGR